MEIQNISVTGFVFCCFLLLISFAVSYYLKLGVIRYITVIMSRMAFQLFLIGMLLTVVFDINSSAVNLVWVFVMLCFASYTILDSADLRVKTFIGPLFLLFSASNIFVLLYFDAFVIELENLFEARYLIPIAGMLAGNSLRANIVGLNDLYRSVSTNEHRYLYRLGLGATRQEALLPHIRESMNSALRPTFANMATMGIVFLPGMMTGQILAGASPILAIKYQITIMIAIFVTTILGVLICLMVFVRLGFDEFHILKPDLSKIKK